MRLNGSQKAALRRLVDGFGPLSYRERETARRFHAMGLIRTNNIEDPSYVTLSEAGKRALDDRSSRDPIPRRRRDPATKSYRGWSIERETGAVHLGYQTASGKRGKGRKSSGYWLTRKPDESGYVAKKWVDTLADAKRYIDEYEGDAVERDHRHPRLHRRAAKLGLERHPRKRRVR